MIRQGKWWTSALAALALAGGLSSGASAAEWFDREIELPKLASAEPSESPITLINNFELADESAMQPASSTVESLLSSGCCRDAGCGLSGAGCGCDSWMGLGSLFCSCNRPETNTEIFDLDFRSDRAFERFIEPVTNSVFFEDPRSRTRVRFLFLNQTIPNGTPVLGGGQFQVYGLQATFALSERVSIIAQKDGFINLDADNIKDDGWANLATGLKYVLYRNVETQTLLSTGVMYEWSNGSSEVFQGNGDGVWSPFLTGGQEIACNTHIITTIGGHFPSDPRAQSTSLYYSLHLDHALTEKFYALWELNGLHYTRSGSALPLSFEGGDLINLGSNNVAGNHIVTTAFGGTYIFNPNWQSALAYEIPLTGRQDLMSNRLTFTLSFIY